MLTLHINIYNGTSFTGIGPGQKKVVNSIYKGLSYIARIDDRKTLPCQNMKSLEQI
jgi:hypothetical protein